MKATGIVRKFDPLGRIVIPKELRNSYHIDADTPVEIFVDGDAIVLKVHEESCMFCGEIVNLNPIMGKLICPHCAKSILPSIEHAAGR